MTSEFQRTMVKAMAITGVVIIPVGLVLSAVFAGWKGFLGALAGFALASINTLAVIYVLKWAMGKPLQILPAILSSSYFARLLVLAGSLYGLTRIEAFNIVAMLLCFLVLYLAHTTVEMVMAWKSLGIMQKSEGQAQGE